MSEQSESKVISLSNLAPNPGARRRAKRKGIGEGSGNGKTCGRGHKGQKSRSGASIPAGFEGGQMPLHRRLPKIGFTSRKRVRGENLFRVVSLARLAEIAGESDSVTLSTFQENRVLRGKQERVKVLGGGSLEKKLVVEAHAFSQSAKAAIEAAGGEAKVVGS